MVQEALVAVPGRHLVPQKRGTHARRMTKPNSSQATSYNGISQQHFHLFIKECEWRFNYRPVANLTKVLQLWWFK